MKKLVALVIVAFLITGCSLSKSNTRYIKQGDGVVFDIETGLMWSEKSLDEAIAWESADEFCEAYKLGGYGDWRMPTQKELETIIDYANSVSASSKKFINIKAPRLWTADQDSSANYAAYFDLEFYSSYYTLKEGSIKAGILPVRSTVTIVRSKRKRPDSSKPNLD